MNIHELLAELVARGVHVQSEGEQLTIRAPKNTLTPEMRKQLAEHKVEILALLRQHQEQANALLLQRLVVDIEARYAPFPLTDMQQAYWIGRSGAFESGQVACQAYGEIEVLHLDREKLDFVLQRLIRHHDMLRMIVRPDGQQQILAQVPPYQIQVVDLRHGDASIATNQLETIRQEMSHRVSKTDHWPLFEIRVSCIDDKRSRIHVRLDLLIGDAMSLMLFMSQWSSLYHNPDTSLTTLEFSFRDYVLSEIAARDSQQYQRARNYWHDRLPTLPPAPELPLTQDITTTQMSHFIRRSAIIKVDIWQRLKVHGAQAGLTPSGLLCAAFAEVLATWSKSPRFTLNLTFFNRLPVHPQVYELMGDFASTILLEVNSSQRSFEARARHLQEQLSRDLEHSIYSGVRVLRELNRLRGGSTAAAMPIVFTSNISSLTTTYVQTKALGEIVNGITQTPQVWLDHQVSEQNGALTITWDAVEARFPSGLLDDMFEAFQHLLHRLALEEEAWHQTQRDLLPFYQRQQQERFNETAGPVSEDLLHTLFLQQAHLHSQYLAVIAPDRTLSYAQLEQEATQAAHWLRAHGAHPNQLVAILMPKGWQQVVGALAVLLAGAAYLPIDPDLPWERIVSLLVNGEVHLALTVPGLYEHITWPASVLPGSIGDEAILEQPTTALPILSRPEDLAYVIYTSGSTGQPKGVMIEHRAVVNTLLDLNARFAVTSQDRVLALSSLSFDLSVYDIFGLLAAGGTIVMPAPHASRDPAQWLPLLERHRVTLWNSVPALMEMLLTYVQARQHRLPASVRSVWLSGDWIPLGLPPQLQALLPGVQLISMGGATEAAIWSISYLIEIEQLNPSWSSIPYGRPLRNQHFYVLNEALEPCPFWVPGHLYIGGLGLARGYWADPARTQRHFLPHPHSGERLYSTGDLGRLLPGGVIEFLGREDFQVKIRGHRIELGEIEAMLLEHSQVRAAVVVAHGEQRRRQSLVAYVVLEAEAQASSEELRQFVANKLPDYMVPTVILELTALPLTTNGKVDRNALPDPEAGRAADEHTFVAPRSDLEEDIAHIWSRILNIEQIGVYDNFFELGGDSLQGIQIMNAIREAYQVELSPAHLFEKPTVARLALMIEELIIDQILAISSDKEAAVQE